MRFLNVLLHIQQLIVARLDTRNFVNQTTPFCSTGCVASPGTLLRACDALHPVLQKEVVWFTRLGHICMVAQSAAQMRSVMAVANHSGCVLLGHHNKDMHVHKYYYMYMHIV